MKLTNQQIEALASRIQSELLKPFLDFNSSIKNSKEYKNFIIENKDCKELQKICEKYPKNSDRYTPLEQIKGVQEEIKYLYFKDKFKAVPSISRSSIEQEIILGTIDCEGLDKLIETVKSKFNQSL